MNTAVTINHQRVPVKRSVSSTQFSTKDCRRAELPVCCGLRLCNLKITLKLLSWDPQRRKTSQEEETERKGSQRKVTFVECLYSLFTSSCTITYRCFTHIQAVIFWVRVQCLMLAEFANRHSRRLFKKLIFRVIFRKMYQYVQP